MGQQQDPEHLVLLLAEFVYRPWKEAAAAALRGASQGGSQAVADAQQAQDVQVRWPSQRGRSGPAEALWRWRKEPRLRQGLPSLQGWVAGSNVDAC